MSGPDAGSEGCLLESGLGYLQDGDVVTMRGVAGAGSDERIDLGEVTGEVVA